VSRVDEFHGSTDEDLSIRHPRERGRYARVFDWMNTNRGRIIGVNFLWMSGLHPDLVTYFVEYYGMSSVPNFRAYLESLGIQQYNGTEKQAWNDEGAHVRRHGRVVVSHRRRELELVSKGSMPHVIAIFDDAIGDDEVDVNVQCPGAPSNSARSSSR
jgi:hypothetical protein